MTIEFEQTVKAMDGHIEVLKQDLLFAMEAKCKPQNMTQEMLLS